MVGELDAGNPHVQFDEGAQETYDIAARLCPTLPEPLASLVRGCEKLARQAKPPAPPSFANPCTASEVGQTVAGPPGSQFILGSDKSPRMDHNL